MAKKTPEQVFNEYQMAYFCGNRLLPNSFYNLSNEEQIEVAARIKEANKKNEK